MQRNLEWTVDEKIDQHDVAKYLSVGTRTIRTLIKRCELPPPRSFRTCPSSDSSALLSRPAQGEFHDFRAPIAPGYIVQVIAGSGRRSVERDLSELPASRMLDGCSRNRTPKSSIASVVRPRSDTPAYTVSTDGIRGGERSTAARVGRRARSIANTELAVQVAAIHAQSRRSYGPERIVRQLHTQGLAPGHERVRKSLLRQKLRPVYRRPYRVTTDSKHDKPIAANILNRRFAGCMPLHCGKLRH